MRETKQSLARKRVQARRTVQVLISEYEQRCSLYYRRRVPMYLGARHIDAMRTVLALSIGKELKQ